MSAKVKVNGGAPTVTDGSFTETKELIAGYTLIEVRSREEAIAWARRDEGIKVPDRLISSAKS